MNQNYTGGTVNNIYDAIHQPKKPSGNPNYGGYVPTFGPCDLEIECLSVTLLNGSAEVLFIGRDSEHRISCSKESAMQYIPGKTYSLSLKEKAL